MSPRIRQRMKAVQDEFANEMKARPQFLSVGVVVSMLTLAYMLFTTIGSTKEGAKHAEDFEVRISEQMSKLEDKVQGQFRDERRDMKADMEREIDRQCRCGGKD